GAMDLNRAIDHVAQHGRGHGLDHGDLLTGNLVAVLVHAACSVQGQHAGLVDFAARANDHFLHAAQLVHRLVEGNLLGGAAAHGFQRTPGLADGTHAVVDAARPEASLGDIEPATLTPQDVLGWN